MGEPFPRGGGPLVSISLPTRGRPKLLSQAVDSLYSLARDKLSLEFLIRADSDDYETINIASRLVQLLPQATLVVEPRGMGYVNIHLWHDRLCRLARGDWVLIFNDDALMTVEGWDEKLARLPCNIVPCPDIALGFFVSKNRPACNEFFILRRRAWEILGYFSQSTHADNWLFRVFSQCSSCFQIPQMVIDHFSGELDDQTRKDSVAAYRNGELARETLESPQAQQGINQAVVRLVFHIEKYQKAKDAEMGPHGLDDEDLKSRIQKICSQRGIKAIVETGVNEGGSTIKFSAMAPVVFGIDLDSNRLAITHKNITARKITNVVLCLGNSPDVLRSLAHVLPDETLYFLDAHWNSYWPLLDEIAKIKPKTGVIVFHDMAVPDQPELGYDTYNGNSLDYAYVKDSLVKWSSTHRIEYNSRVPGIENQRGVGFVFPE